MSSIVTILKYAGAILAVIILTNLYLYNSNTLNTEAASRAWSRIRPRQRMRILLIFDLLLIIMAAVIFVINF